MPKFSRSPVMAPYLYGDPEVWTEQVSSDRYLAFNFANPTGVKLLNSETHQRLQKILIEGYKPNSIQDEIGLQLQKSGLIQNNNEETNVAKKPPLSIWLHLLNGCNFNCFYCYIPQLEKNISKEVLDSVSFPESEIETLLTRLLDYVKKYDYPYLHIKFAGGEPTQNMPLLKRFCKIVSIFQHNHKITLGMISNGSFHPYEVADLVSRFKISLSISVDGFEETHDKTRFTVDDNKKIGSWDIIDRNIAHLINQGIQPYFLYTVTEFNVSSVQAFSMYSYTQGLGMRLSLVRMTQPPKLELVKTVAETLANFYRNLPDILPVKLRVERDAKFAEWDTEKKKKTACGSCKNYFAISEQGNVSSCQMTLDQPFGNVFTEDFATLTYKAEQNPEQHFLFHSEDKVAGCSKCQYKYFCTGGCPQHTKAIYGTYDSASAWCQVYGVVVPEYLRAIAKHTLNKIEFIKQHEMLLENFSH